jgi:polyisoprenoid-binding protein YceI
MTSNRTLLAITFVFFAMQSFSQSYTIDPGHTSILSKVMRFGVVKVVGRFNTVSGNVTFDQANPEAATGEIKITTESYSANNADGEKAVKSPAFLDAAKFPEIAVKIKGLSKSANGYQASADLTLHGVTKEISFPISINGPFTDLPSGKKSIGISGMFTLNRQDYGIGMSRKTPEGNELIGSLVEIEINALALAN